MPERFGRNGAFTCVSGAEAAVVAGAGRESRLGDDPLRPTRPAPCEIGQPVPCGPERCPPSLGTVDRVSDTRPPYSPQGPTPQCNSYQRRQRRFGSADGGDSGECSARVGSLARSDAPTGRRTAGCLSISFRVRGTCNAPPSVRLARRVLALVLRRQARVPWRRRARFLSAVAC